MIETDIRTAVIADPTINAIIGSGSNARMYLKNPLREPSQPYIVFFRISKTRDMVREQNNFRFIAHSKDLVQLETLCDALIDFFENKKDVNNNFYFSVSLVWQNDSRERLENGFYWSMLNFEFKHTT